MSARKLEQQTRTLRRKRRTADQAPPASWAPVASAKALLASGVLDHATAGEPRQALMRELQEQSGNQHVQRLLAEQQAESTGERTGAASPQPKSTDYGTFLVGSDDRPASLASARDIKAEWPVTAQIFDRLQKVIDVLKGGASEFEFKGGAAFKVALLMDFDWLMTQSSGPELLKALANTGKKLTIEYAPGENQQRAVAESDAEVRPDGTPGPGSNVEMRYTTAAWMPSGGNAAWEQRAPATGLARMLVAALPAMSGTSPTTKEREPVIEGQQATGHDKIKQAIALENSFRAVFGMPLRPEE